MPEFSEKYYLSPISVKGMSPTSWVGLADWSLVCLEAGALAEFGHVHHNVHQPSFMPSIRFIQLIPVVTLKSGKHNLLLNPMQLPSIAVATCFIAGLLAWTPPTIVQRQQRCRRSTNSPPSLQLNAVGGTGKSVGRKQKVTTKSLASTKEISDLETRLVRKFARSQGNETAVKGDEKKATLAKWGREAELGSSFIIRQPMDVSENSPRKPSRTKPAMAKRNTQLKVKAQLNGKTQLEQELKGMALSNLVSAVEGKDRRSFVDLGVDAATVNALATNFDAFSPMPIQRALLTLEVKDKDLLVQAPTGSGKTLAYLLATTRCESLTPFAVLVIAPSREVGSQIARVSELSMRPCVACCGGSNVRRQLAKLRSTRPMVVAGTPGRLADIIFEHKQLKLASIRWCIIDEVDAYEPRALEDINSILLALPKSARLLLTSASASELVGNQPLSELQRRAAKALAISTASQAKHPALAANIAHGRILTATSRQAIDALRRVLRASDPQVKAALVFTKDAKEASELADKLVDMSFDVHVLSGDEPDHKRANAIRALAPSNRKKRRRDSFDGPPVVVATELAARGIDAPALTHVINYCNLPSTPTHYAHRAGRSGRRARAVGFMLTIAPPADSRKIDALANKLGVRIHEVKLQRGVLVVSTGDTSDISGAAQKS